MTGMSRDRARPPLAAADERLWSSLAHFGNIVTLLPALLIFLVLGARSAVVRAESREALNLSLTALIAWIALAVLGQVFGSLYAALPVGLDLAFGVLRLLVGFASLVVWVLVVLFSVVAGLRVQHGGGFRYPLALRLVR